MADRPGSHGLLGSAVTTPPSSEGRWPARHPRRRLDQGGFSLLEVVVAFAILALSLGLLIQVFSRALNTTALSGDYSRAATLAQARLDAVGVDVPLEPGSYSGEPEDGFSWQVFIEPYEPEDLPWELPLASFLVTSVISWDNGGGKQRGISLTTLRLGEDSAFAGLDFARDPAFSVPSGDALDP